MKRAHSMNDAISRRDSPDMNDARSVTDSMQPSAGAMLRDAREAAGLHIGALAVALKVPVNKLEALEHDRVDLLPDAVFARALTASVCRNLKVDPAPILGRLPQTGLPRLNMRDQRLQPRFDMASSQSIVRSRQQISTPAWISGGSLAIAALVIVFLPDVQKSIALVQEKAADWSAPRSPDTAPLSLDMSTMRPISAASGSQSIGKTSGDKQDEVDQAAGSLSQTAAAVELSRSAAAGDLNVSGVDSSLLRLTASRESWVQVIDAKGSVVLRRLLSAGETAATSGALPMEVVVGRADATRVEVRGKVLDLGPLARDNVAKFEVK